MLRGGLNPYLFLPANVREQASWAHPHSPLAATEKATRLVRAAVAKARLLEPLEMVSVAAIHRALVVGGGVAGLRAALDLARQGMAVTLVERSPFLGGRAAQLHTVFPTEELARPLVHRLIREVLAQPNVTVLTGTEVTTLTGYVGDFHASLRTDAARRHRRAGRHRRRDRGLSRGGLQRVRRRPEPAAGDLPAVSRFGASAAGHRLACLHPLWGLRPGSRRSGHRSR